MNIKGHFETITRHKLLVMKYCFACGLYEQGLAHDLSKYSPTEFIPGCIYYQGDHSPNEAKREARGYTSAWLHHKGRNKHHLEYWIDYSTTKAGLTGMKPHWFLVASLAGMTLWNIILVGAGYLLHEHYHLVESWLDPLTYIVLGGIVLVYLYRVITWKPHA